MMKHRSEKRIFVVSMLVCIMLMLVFVPMPVCAAQIVGSQTAGSQTVENQIVMDGEPIETNGTIYIGSPQELVELAENCIDDNWSHNKVVILKNDINMTGIEFSGIPTFGGIFLGQGHTISGLSLRQNSSVVGLFRYTQVTAVIDRVNVEGYIQPEGSGNKVGGIVGNNRGTIKNCTFNGTVSGKEQVGGIVGVNEAASVIENCNASGVIHGNHYIGGIAGSQNGYIVDCINYAKIEGSDGVGGIVGQFKPNMVLEFGADPVKVMKGQMNSMAASVKGLGNSISELELNLSGSSMDLNAELNNIKNSLEALEKPEINENLNKAENLNQLGDLNQLKELNGLEDLSQLGDLSKLGDLAQSGDLSQLGDLGNLDVNALLDSLQKQETEDQEGKEEKESDLLNSVMNNFSNSFNNIYKEGEEIKEAYKNSSSEALNEVTGKMNSMMNQMQGMINTAGSLVSNVGVNVNDISRADTPEDTIGKVTNCENYGEVAGENAVGGIAGNMVYGAIIGSCNIGNMDALSADYVGGIAGSCNTVIMNCYSKSIVAGENAVGGIAGYGSEVYDSFALTDIAACMEYGGEILGNAKELPMEGNENIKNNFYCFAGKDFGGIDGINYLNATGRINLEEFLALENLDEMFKTVQVCFKAEGQEDVILNTGTGKNIAKENIPQLMVEEGQMYDWRFVEPVVARTLSMNEEEEVFYLTEDRLNNILFNQIYEADYAAKNMVSQGSGKTEDNHSIILAIGAFEKGTSVELEDMLQQEYVILGETALQNWKVNISNPGVKKLHYRIPEGMDAKDLKLLIKDNSGNWTEREHMVEGSYLVFEFADSESGFALVEKESFKLNLDILAGFDFKIIVAGIAAVIVLLFMIIYIKKNYTIVKKGKE